MFAEEVGAPLRRTLLRWGILRPPLVRAGLLGDGTRMATAKHIATFDTEPAAVRHDRATTTLDPYTRRTDDPPNTTKALVSRLRSEP